MANADSGNAGRPISHLNPDDGSTYRETVHLERYLFDIVIAGDSVGFSFFT